MSRHEIEPLVRKCFEDLINEIPDLKFMLNNNYRFEKIISVLLQYENNMKTVDQNHKKHTDTIHEHDVALEAQEKKLIELSQNLSLLGATQDDTKRLTNLEKDLMELKNKDSNSTSITEIKAEMLNKYKDELTKYKEEQKKATIQLETSIGNKAPVKNVTELKNDLIDIKNYLAKIVNKGESSSQIKPITPKDNVENTILANLRELKESQTAMHNKFASLKGKGNVTEKAPIKAKSPIKVNSKPKAK